MSLLGTMGEVEVKARKAGATQAVQSRTIDMGRLEEFATLVEAALPNCRRHDKAIAGGGTLADQVTKVVAYAVIQATPVKANVVVYHNGNAVFAGIEPVALP